MHTLQAVLQAVEVRPVMLAYGLHCEYIYTYTYLDKYHSIHSIHNITSVDKQGLVKTIRYRFIFAAFFLTDCV